MKYPKFRLVWDSPEGESPSGPRLVSRLVGTVCAAVQRTLPRGRRRLRAWTPWLRLAANAAIMVAALAFIAVVGTKQTIDIPPVPDSLPADAPSGSWSPMDDGISLPAPWGVRIPQIRTPGLDLPTVHIGFRDLPDLSATLEAGLAAAEIRGGTSIDGPPPQVDAAVVASTLGFVAVLTTVVGVIRRWSRWRRGAPPADVDASPAAHGIEEDKELLTDAAEAGEPTPPPAADANPMEPAESDTHSADNVDPPATGASDLHEATSVTPKEVEYPTQALDAGRGPVPSPPSSGTSAMPTQATSGRERPGEEASSRVVLFTATKWDG
jgi:hypothetical protein